MKQYIVIGNGVAAAGCIEGIREQDKEGAITVVSAEKYPVYCRPLISYYLEGKAHPDRMNYRPADFYEKNGARVLYGVRAEQLDASAKTVTLNNGEVLSYDEVCVATGSTPFVPPTEGLEKVKKQFTFLTMDDMLALDAAITPESRVLIVGAGLIGLKCAEGLKERVASITVCDLADRVLSSIMDASCAQIMQKHLEAQGIKFLLSDCVTRFTETTASFKSGAEVPFTVLVLAVGVRANTGLVKTAGGDVNRGIVVDTAMKTSLPSVYAAGDCAEGFDSVLGQNRVLAILPNAYAQGRTAGRNMAGGSDTLEDSIPENAIGFFGLHALSAGVCFPKEQGGETYSEEDGENVKRLYTKDGLLTGFVLIGNTVSRAGMYTSLIRKKTPLSEIDFERMKKNPDFLAFSKETRSNLFGGVV